jgi:hypothetical protein
MRLDRDKGRDTTGGHSQRVPSPCEVSKAFAKGKVGLVWVLLVGNLRMVVPTIMTMSFFMLELLRISHGRDSLYWARLLGRVAERVLRSWLVTLVVNWISIGINWAREVALSSWEWSSWSLYPGVGTSSLTRRWL